MDSYRTRLGVKGWGIAFVLVAVLTGGIWGNVQSVRAQSGNVDWSLPVNLSRSGAATNPVMAVTADGRFHIVWTDAFAGAVYSSGDGIEWTTPVPVAFPFETFIPRLVVEASGPVHAFWMDEKSALFYSRLQDPASFGEGSAWTRPILLGYQSILTDAIVDASGRIHMAYIQTVDYQGVPAGIYYRQFAADARGRGKWSNPVALFQSPYVRSFTPQNANLKLSFSSGAGGDRVFAVWDNPARERVFFARSLDGGVNWEAPVEIDTPSDASVAGGPSHINVATLGESLLLLWQSENTGSSCSQYFQWSQDGGTTWQPKQRMLQDVPGCPSGNQIFIGQNNRVFLMTAIQDQTYLLAWNGTDWSKPQLQVPLSNFVDPETFRPVTLACRQSQLVGGRSLYVLGCDVGDGKDVWITTRQLDQVDAWFTENLVWSPLAVITSGQIKVLHPTLASDTDNRIHAFWSQPDSVSANGSGTVLYYARLENGQWSSPGPILTSPDGAAENPSAITGDGRLYLAWSGGQAGQIYFSRANIVQASVSSAWNEPMLLPSPQPAGSSPSIQRDGQGVLYVAFAVPLNEQRGIYLIHSTDGGDSWSTPVQVFDAAAAGWGMVDKPRLSIGTNGALHIVFTRATIPSGIGSQGLYYARSLDQGTTWQTAAVVENPVLWSQILAVGDQVVHRAWQELSAGRTTLWHEASIDGGQTWSRVAPVSIFGDTIGEPALSRDGSGRLHLLQVVSRGISGYMTQGYALQHWMYNGEQWVSEQSLDMGDTVASNLRNLTATVATNGTLGTAFSGDIIDPVTGLAQQQFFFTSRGLDMSGTVPIPELPQGTVQAAFPTPTALPQPQPSVTPITTTGPIAIADLPQNPGGGSSWLGSIIGPLAAGLIVLVVFVVGARGVGLRRR